MPNQQATERVIDAYTQTLQQGNLGLAFLLVIVIILLAIVIALFIRYLAKKDGEGEKTDQKAQENISSLIQLQQGQQAILERMTSTLEGIQRAQETNNDLKVKQTEAFTAQENQLKAIHTSLIEWPKAYIAALDDFRKSVDSLKQWVETAVLQRDGQSEEVKKYVREQIQSLLTELTPVINFVKNQSAERGEL